jgi:hypothetical protein
MISINKYNPRVDMKPCRFKEPHGLNLTRYAKLPRRLIKDGIFATLSPSACAVLPVLYCLQDSKGVVRHSISTIACFTGFERHATSRGIMELVDLPEPYKVRYETQITDNGHYKYWFYIPPVGSNKGDFFPFRHCIIESGIWAQVSSAGKRVYLALRTFNDVFLTNIAEDTATSDDFLNGGLDTNEKKKAFGTRPFDVCTAEQAIIAEISNIRKQETLQKAANNLERFGLMGNNPDGVGWRVYLTPHF